MSPSAQAFAVGIGEGLEGFLIVAVLIGFLRHTGRYQLVPAVRWGIGLSVPLSIGAAMMFAQASNQAQSVRGHLRRAGGVAAWKSPPSRHLGQLHVAAASSACCCSPSC